MLDAASDEFYARHRYSNYGEVGLAVKEAVEKFGAASALHRQVCARQLWRRGALLVLVSPSRVSCPC